MYCLEVMSKVENKYLTLKNNPSNIHMAPWHKNNFGPSLSLQLHMHIHTNTVS